MGIVVPVAQKTSYKFFTFLAHFDGIVGMVLNVIIMAQPKGNGKRKKANSGIAIRLQSSTGCDAEERLRQAYSLAFLVAENADDTIQDNGCHAKQHKDSAQSWPMANNCSGDEESNEGISRI